MWRLEVLDWAGAGQWRWRWRLLNDKGAYETDHQVALDTTAWQFDALLNLDHYLKWAAAPDRRGEHQAEIVAQVGEWVGQHVLGPSIGKALARRRGPVHLAVPTDAAVLGHLPWELARVDGRTLAGHRTNLVVVPELPTPSDDQAGAKQPVGGRLRMLAVFSLPDGVGALNLRKERVALARLVQRIARVNNKAIELRVLQYGATRDRLDEALDEAEGWDVVHLSGHGLAGGVVLEDAAGRHDLITSDDLVDLLDRGRDQIKLVTLSACESAAVTAAEHLRQIGLDPAVRDTPADPPSVDAPAPPPRKNLPAVASALVTGLDCAVLAMRYPVIDDFAIALTGSFYDLLLGKGQPVARALALSLTQRTVVPERPTPATPALSVGTPVLFGPRAADLTLTAPRGQSATITSDTTKLAAFPDQPARFVGRVGALTRASEVLAPESGCPGVVFHGMAGAGKTACALELAYTHELSFPLMAWYAAPEDAPGGVEIRPALASFALATERQLPDMLQWVHLVDDPARLRAFLPQLTQVFKTNRILLMLDNVESLLTDTGEWRDERWGWVLGALTNHAGYSRVVVTSRRLPVGLPGSVLVEPVHALSREESVLLARELPHLRGLIDGTHLPAGLTTEAGRQVAARVLGVVQGHPKLLELADGAAVDPAELQSRLAEADEAWLAQGTRLSEFLRGDTSAASGDDFGAVLAGWTRSATEGLPADAVLLLRVLCGAEEADRAPNVMHVVWPLVWERTGREAPASALDAVLPLLVARALVAEERDARSAEVVGWRVHPGVADAVRADTIPELAAVVDDVIVDGWLGTLRDARARESTEQAGAWALRAARSAAPYLLRRGRWDDLDVVAEEVLARDNSVGAAAVLAPMLQVAAEATSGGERELELGRAHARVLLRLDPPHGLVLLEGLLGVAVARGLYADAFLLAGDLINRYQDQGRYTEALSLADQKVEYSRRIGFGPWTQLADQAQRLQIQRRQGRSREVLDGVEALRAGMAVLPAQPDPATDGVDVWNVRETLFNIGALAARELGLWERALALNAEILASLRGRGAGAYEQARHAFNDYGPLVRLGRLPQAREVLISCREVFEQVDDVLRLGQTLGALADVEEAWGHPERAVDLAREALRFTYAAGDPDAVGVSHHNLANYLQDGGAEPGVVGAHRVAAAVISYQTASGRLPGRLAALSQALAGGDGARVPQSFARVCGVVGQIPGVDLAALLDRLPARAPDPDTAVHAVLVAAQEAAAAERADQVEQAAAGWEPVVSALHAALAEPDSDARAAATTAFTGQMDRYADTDDWHQLVATLRRIHAGERDPEVLLAGLDDIDTAVVRRALDVLAGTATVDPDAWRTLLPPDHG